MEIQLKIKKIDVLLTSGTDIINIFLDAESSFPIMQYDTVMKIECQKGYGEEYCKKIFGIIPTIKNCR
jgi:hypothetical protein